MDVVALFTIVKLVTHFVNLVEFISSMHN